jgi:hypothetical protein
MQGLVATPAGPTVITARSAGPSVITARSAGTSQAPRAPGPWHARFTRASADAIAGPAAA